MPTYKITSRKTLTFETVIEAGNEDEALRIHNFECEFDDNTASEIRWDKDAVEEVTQS